MNFLPVSEWTTAIDEGSCLEISAKIGFLGRTLETILTWNRGRNARTGGFEKEAKDAGSLKNLASMEV